LIYLPFLNHIFSVLLAELFQLLLVYN